MMSRGLSRVDCHRQALPRAQGVVQLALRLPVDLDAFHSPGKGRQQDFCLHTGDGLSDAAMNAHAKADVARSIAANVEPVGVCPASWVAVGGAEEEQYLFSLRNAHTGDFNFACCRPKECLDG